MIGFASGRIAAQTTLVSVASYLAGFYFTELFHAASASMGALWSAVSGIVVLQATQRDTWSSASLRIFGSLIGAVTSAAYLSVLPFSPIGMAVSIFVTVLLCHVARIPDHARLAAITVVVIMVITSIDPTLNPISNAALRFSESFIGATIAVFAALLWPGPKDLPSAPLPDAQD
ncbi:FUSC family protein [Halothiobacillus sp.]|uniref:FUSC family protein n=1 Tax=Halothiobacillus sp. TaxID=1891311 RepID=UPI002AD54A34|nr:FUSC family protein [Halothiobacillus sp.]